MSEPLLAVDDVHTYYGQSYILQGVSLSTEAGRVVSVLGRNGVGKTTLMRTAIAFTQARRGHVRLDGVDVTRWPPYRIARRGMALVPQGRRIFPTLSVAEHLDIARRQAVLPSEAHGGRPVSLTWDTEKIYGLFPRLQERANNRAKTLSGGERQMLALARALMANPRVLLMDEPTEGLSPFIVADIQDLIKRLRDNGVAVLLVEQNIEFALGVSDFVHVMDKGKIVVSGPPEELSRNQQAMETYLGL